MPRYISSEQKLSIIEDWLNGEKREDIARKHNIGNGTVYYTVQEWSKSIGIQKAEVLRELGIALKKNKLTVFDCAQGFRTISIFKKYGIKENEVSDQVTFFLNEIYMKCQEANLSIQKIFWYICDIINFSKEISITNIPQYIKDKKKEKERLEDSIKSLNQQIKELKSLQKEHEYKIQKISKISSNLSRQYSLFSIIKFKLNKQRMSLENLDQFVDCVKGVARENYNVTKVLERM